MGGAVFYSYKPYLHLALSRECIITFNEKGIYIAKTPEEEKLLREYAKNTRNSYNIIEAGGELEHEDLIRLHEEDEQKLIAEAEQRERQPERRRKGGKKRYMIFVVLLDFQTRYIDKKQRRAERWLIS